MVDQDCAGASPLGDGGASTVLAKLPASDSFVTMFGATISSFRVVEARTLRSGPQQLREPVARERPALQHEQSFVARALAVQRAQVPQVGTIEWQRRRCHYF